MTKPKLATVHLAGCFGCHMSLLDIDDRILQLVDLVDFDRSPLDDLKRFSPDCAIGLIEGGCANEENVEVLCELRKHCKVIVSVGMCAIDGDIPSLRNFVPLRECLEEAYLHGPSVYNPDGVMPNDPELPLLLDRVYPCHEVVKVDYFLPGCPPSAECLWQALTALLSDRPISLPYELIKYD